VGKFAAAVRRCSCSLRIVERRIHQDSLSRFGMQPGGGKSGCRGFHIEIKNGDALLKAVETRVLLRERSKRCLKLDQRDFGARNAGRDRKPGRADSGTEIDDVFSGTARTRGRQQYGVMSNPMAVLELPQAQSAAEDRILGHR
jgi:hypothetical protein